MITVGPTGTTVRGDVLDVSMPAFIRSLKDIDPLLYVKWNHKKLKGWGCWEIRRAPSVNSIQDVVEYQDQIIFQLGPVENDLVNHILDCAYLNYDQLRKLKEMDTWALGETAEQGSKKWLDRIDERERQNAKDAQIRAAQARKYAAKHYKKEIDVLREAVLSGYNPHRIADEWEKVGSDL